MDVNNEKRGAGDAAAMSATPVETRDKGV